MWQRKLIEHGKSEELSSPELVQSACGNHLAGLNRVVLILDSTER